MIEQLVDKINAKIKANGKNQITGSVLNEVMLAMVGEISGKTAFGGVITPESISPKTTDSIFFVATEPGVYEHFSDITIGESEYAFILRSGNEWVKYSIHLPQGPQGIQGEQGVQGPQGEQGIQGEPGPANTLSIGTVQSGEIAAASITGESPEQVLNLTLPKGDKGDKGDAGHNPNLGTYLISNYSTDAPTTNILDGDYIVVVDNTVTPKTSEIYKWNGSAWVTTGRDANDAEFATNELVGSVSIINDLFTGGEHDVLSAEQGKILGKKLSGVNYTEVLASNYNTYNGRIKGSNGQTSDTSSTTYNFAFIGVSGYESVRFLGAVMRSDASSSDKNIGYAFGYFNNNVWYPLYHYYWDVNTTNTTVLKEYNVQIPDDPRITFIGVTCKIGSLLTNSNFYLYKSKVDTILTEENIYDIVPTVAEPKRTIVLDGVMTQSSTAASTVKLPLKYGSCYRVYRPDNWQNTVTLTSELKFFIQRINGSNYDIIGENTDDYNLIPPYFDIIAEENDYYQFGVRADSGISVNIVIEEIDISSNDIVLSFSPINNGYVVPSTGENVYSGTGNQSFIRMRPTLGKKYLDVSWMILLYSTNDLDRGLAWYDVNKNYLYGIKLGEINVDENQRGTWPLRLRIPKDAAYFNLTYWGSYSIGQYPYLSPRWSVVLTDKEEVDMPVFDGDFGRFIGFASYDGPTGDTLMNQTYTTLISQWDAVQSVHSDMISQKKLLGYGTSSASGVAQPDMNYPIYEYVVNPIKHNDTGTEEYLTTDPKNIAKILIVSGVHGAEKPSSTSVLELVKNLVGHYNGTKSDSAYISLAQNCEYHIIPCVNPYSYDAKGRNNARGVNINRNFGHNWTYQAGNDTTDKGSEAYSELETQIVRDWIAENKDAFIYIDAHTSYVSSSPLQGCYSYAFDYTSKLLLNSYIKIVSIFATQQWPTIFTNKQYIGFNGYNNQACTASEARYVNNIPRVATLEINTNAGGLGRGNEEQIVLSLNQIVNYIRMCIDWQLKRN